MAPTTEEIRAQLDELFMRVRDRITVASVIASATAVVLTAGIAGCDKKEDAGPGTKDLAGTESDVGQVGEDITEDAAPGEDALQDLGAEDLTDWDRNAPDRTDPVDVNDLQDQEDPPDVKDLQDHKGPGDVDETDVESDALDTTDADPTDTQQPPVQCYTDDDCADTQTCVGASLCPDGAFCILPDQPGTCQDKPEGCFSAQDCPEDMACVGGGPNCPDGMFCILPQNPIPGECVPITECVTDDECAEGLTCAGAIPGCPNEYIMCILPVPPVPGKCINEGLCQSDADCPDGQTCHGFMTCPEDASCPMPDRPGYCQEPKECQTNEDCSKGYVCKGAITCPDGAMCILPDQPGTCVWVLGGEGVWMAGNATEATNPADTPWRSMIQVALASFGRNPDTHRDEG